MTNDILPLTPKEIEYEKKRSGAVEWLKNNPRIVEEIKNDPVNLFNAVISLVGRAPTSNPEPVHPVPIESNVQYEYMISHYGNARRILNTHPDQFKFHVANKVWMFYDEHFGKWVIDKKGRIQEVIKNMIRGLVVEAQDTLEYAEALPQNTVDEIRYRNEMLKTARELSVWALSCQNDGSTKQCMALLQTHESIAVEPEQFDHNDYLFCCQNVTLDLTGEKIIARDHDRNDLITMNSGIWYDRKATCPEFCKFMTRIFPPVVDPDHPGKTKENPLIDYLQMVMGYCLVGDTSKRKIFMPTGVGNNGKTVLTAIIAGCMGDYGFSLESRSLTTEMAGNTRHDLAQLVGKRFVYSSENRKGSVLDEELIKDLTGGGGTPRKVRELYGKLFDLYPKFKLFWSFNHPPTVKDFTASIWNRIRMIPFDEVIPNNEIIDMAILLKRFEIERSGILNWMIEGYIKLRSSDFDSCPAVMTRTLEYKEESDSMALFFEETCDRYVKKPTDTGLPKDYIPPAYAVPSLELYEIFFFWSKESGIKTPISRRIFSNEVLERLGGRDYRKPVWIENHRQQAFLGIKVNEYAKNRYKDYYGDVFKKGKGESFNPTYINIKK